MGSFTLYAISCPLVAYHSLDFVASSYGLAEQSDSTVGLPCRWLIKGISAAGLWMVMLGILRREMGATIEQEPPGMS